MFKGKLVVVLIGALGGSSGGYSSSQIELVSSEEQETLARTLFKNV